MAEQERPVERETIVTHSRDGGGGGVIALLVVLFVIGAIVFLFLGGYFERAADDVNVNVSIEVPEVELPPGQPAPPANGS